MVQTLQGGPLPGSTARTVKTAASEAMTFEVKWSPDRNWLIVDHVDVQSPQKGPKRVQLPVAQATAMELPGAP